MSVKKQGFEIAVAGQSVETFLYQPEGRTVPGVLLLTDIKGVRDVYHEQAERLAAQGFAVLLPNVFFRGGRLPLWNIPFQFGEERTMKRIQELREGLSPEHQLTDARAYLEALASREGVANGPCGVVGYCFTGGMALRTAAACPERIQAAASFHGGNLFTEELSSPHLLLPRIRASLHVGHAFEDRSMPGAAIAKFDQALANWGGRYVSKVYGRAQHGWTNRDVPIYDPEQAEAAFSALLALLRGALTGENLS